MGKKIQQTIEITEEDYKACYIENDLTRYLDSVLAAANTVPSPVAVVGGMTGSGKTSITLDWLKHNDLPYVYIPAERPISSYRSFELPFFDENHELRLCPTGEVIDIAFSEEEIERMANGDIVVIDNYDLAGDGRASLLRLMRTLTVVDLMGRERKVSPKMIVVIFDDTNSDSFTEEERKLFGLK